MKGASLAVSDSFIWWHSRSYFTISCTKPADVRNAFHDGNFIFSCRSYQLSSTLLDMVSISIIQGACSLFPRRVESILKASIFAAVLILRTNALYQNKTLFIILIILGIVSSNGVSGEREISLTSGKEGGAYRDIWTPEMHYGWLSALRMFRHILDPSTTLYMRR